MAKTSAFQQALEAVEALSLEDREILLDITQNRLHEQRRKQLVQEITEVREEYAQGNVKVGSVSKFLAALVDDEN
ncbi:MAG: hypothetical protein F6K45_15830 [Kamptonema sp. SIO1D9]|nr:hypothetical protein [Kamptonema sp. SIO1D9]